MTLSAEIIHIGPYLADRKTSEISELVSDLAIAEQHAVALMDKLSALASSNMVHSDPDLRENVVNAMRVVEAACSAFELARDEMAIATNRIYLQLFADQMPELPLLTLQDVEHLSGFDLEDVVCEIEAAD
ncbi:hypothetical protein [Agrobacterium tumefaciens]|uniref:hypothetical protein n=1 Tax=Agrobacterium tumefaciens TaxID=358 RepID=UPI0015744554|nr:hypothetical protein [Agrobacterium tumefaciens]